MSALLLSPFGLSLSQPCISSLEETEEQPFDKLRANGVSEIFRSFR
jgi:hypothetical protein